MKSHDYITDIYKLIDVLEEKHIDCYFNISKQELMLCVDEILSKYSINDDYDFYYVANMIMKKMFGQYDSHTRLIFKNSRCSLPIQLKYIDKKLYIVKTSINYENINYGYIKKINGVGIDQLISELELIVPYSTIGFFESQIESTFKNMFKMKSLPSIANDIDSFHYTIVKNDVEMDVNLFPEDFSFSNDTNYSMEINDNVMIITYNSCVQSFEHQMEKFVEKIKLESMKHNIDKYIVDIRGNSGGNSEIIKPLIHFLSNKEVITLIDKYVFSGGRFALIDLINIGSKTVGTGIGTSINCFGNISKNEIGNFILPVSNKYFYLKDNKIFNINNKNDFVVFKNNIYNRKYFDPIIYIPDYIVENKIGDYENNSDSVLEYAIKLFKTEKINYK